MRWLSRTLVWGDIFRRRSVSQHPRFSLAATQNSSVKRLTRFIDHVRQETGYTESHTGHSLTALYSDVASASGLHALAASQLSTLMLFFGHLAHPKPRAIDALYQYQRVIDIASSMRQNGHEHYWGMVIRIGDDMHSLGMPLVDVDHSYMLRAYMHKISTWKDPNLPPADPRTHWAAKARHHYIQIQHLPVWELHCAYFSCMLQMPPDFHRTSDLHQHLCNSLKSFPILSDRFFTVLVYILSKHYHVITEKDKQQILSVIRMRSSTFFRSKWKEVSLSLRSAPSKIGVTPVISMFKDVLLGRHEHKKRSHDWVSRQLSAVLNSSTEREAQWDAFMFFAQYYGQDPVSQEQLSALVRELDPDVPLSSPDGASTAISSQLIPAPTKNIFFLALIQRSLNEPNLSNRIPIESVWNLVKEVWGQWEWKQDRVPLIVERSVLSMFFRLSHQTYDRPFLEGLLMYCERLGLWEPDQSEPDQVLLRSQLDQLAAELAVALFLHEGGRACCPWPKLFEMLRHYVPSSKRSRFALMPRMLEPLIRVGHASEALDLLRYYQRVRPSSQIPPSTVYTLATALATSDDRRSLHESIPFLHQRFNLRIAEQVALLEAILQSVVRNQVLWMRPEDVKLILNVVSTHLTSSIEDFRKLSLETRDILPQCLSIFVHSPHHRKLSRLIRFLASPKVALFRKESDILRLVKALLDVRQHRTASFLHAIARHAFISGTMPTEAYHRIHRTTLFALCKQNSTRLARKVYDSLPSQIERTPMEQIVSYIDFRLNRGFGSRPLRLNPEQVNLITSLVEAHCASLGVIKTAMVVMVNAGHVQLAERFMQLAFDRIKDLDDYDRTHLCQIILQGILYSKFKRRGNRNLTRAHIGLIVRNLESKYDFRMSRVGVNIVLRAWLFNRTLHGFGRATAVGIRRMLNYIVASTPEVRQALGHRMRRRKQVSQVRQRMKNAGLSHFAKFDGVSSHSREMRPMFSSFVAAMKQRGDERGSRLAKATLVTLDILASHDPDRLEWGDLKSHRKHRSKRSNV